MEKKKPENYKRVKQLGQGNFGVAYLVQCKHQKTEAVMKRVDIAMMSEDEKKNCVKEAKILEKMNHPNIIRFREVFKTKSGKLCIVMDYADGGDLANRIKEQRKLMNSTGKDQYFSEDQIIDWFTQIAMGLRHVHDGKVIHRDLKAQNIFLTKENQIKLGDFGIAKVLNSTKSVANTVVGTPYYLSPEVIRGEKYSFPCDIWALGVILYEMCTLTIPFHAESLQLLGRQIMEGQYEPIPKIYSENINEILQACICTDHKNRKSITQILRIPAVQERVQKILSSDEFKDQFSSSIMQNEFIYKTYSVYQKKAQEQKESSANNQDAMKDIQEREKFKKVFHDKYIKEYKTPDFYNQKHESPEFFNETYIQYVVSMNKEPTTYDKMQELQSQTPIDNQLDQQLNLDNEEDDEASEIVSKHKITRELPKGKDISKDDKIKVASFEYEEFQAYMIQEYGESQFKEGYQICKNNRKIFCETNGSQKLQEQLKSILGSEDDCQRFLELCTTFLIVQNMHMH